MLATLSRRFGATLLRRTLALNPNPNPNPNPDP